MLASGRFLLEAGAGPREAGGRWAASRKLENRKARREAREALFWAQREMAKSAAVTWAEGCG